MTRSSFPIPADYLPSEATAVRFGAGLPFHVDERCQERIEDLHRVRQDAGFGIGRQAVAVVAPGKGLTEFGSVFVSALHAREHERGGLSVETRSFAGHAKDE